MKNLPIFLCVFLLLTISSISGQKDVSGNKTFLAVKTDFVFLANNARGGANAGTIIFEQGMAYRHSFQVTAGYLRYTNVTGQAWKFIPEYKFFFNEKNNFKGFYAGVYLKFENFDRSYNSFSSNGREPRIVKETSRTYASGLTFGYQTYIKKHFTLDFLAGLGARHGTVEYLIPPDVNFHVMKSSTAQPFKNVDMRICINLGYRF